MLQYRELFKKLTTSDLKNKYQNASLGFAWSLLSPLLLMLVLWVVFRHMFDMEDFALYLLVGIITWRFFANGTSSALASIVGRKNLITNVYIPRWLITCSSVASSLISSTLEFAVLLPLILILGGQISASALLFPKRLPGQPAFHYCCLPHNRQLNSSSSRYKSPPHRGQPFSFQEGRLRPTGT